MKNDYIAICRKHWSCFIVRGIIAFFLIIGGLSGKSSDGDIASNILMLVIAAILILWAFISYKTEFIAITDKMLVGHVGFIRSKKLSTPLNKVQSVGLNNGLFGKIFRYHTVTIANAGTGIIEYTFHQMANAKAFVDTVNAKIS